ncbi:MAG: type III pantothenate kinase [Candidatus Obscuribacterales bacterium]|nr:type III pantothenate kinase [Candidatus Obscuribacterales bacterium]
MTTRVAVNIGNSRITCGIFVDSQLIDLTHHISSNADKAAADIVQRASAMRAQEIAICSVVPIATRHMLEYFKNHKVQARQIKTDNQNIITGVYDTLGVDRIANVVAALKIHVPSEAAIVLDLGTATTLTAVAQSGEFLGGLITLGLGRTYAALHETTAQLPNLQFDTTDHEITPLANNTAGAIASGCFLGHVGIIENWVKAVRQKLNSDCTVIATGGYANLIAPYTDIFDHVDSNLTMYGINLIAEEAMDLVDQD